MQMVAFYVEEYMSTLHLFLSHSWKYQNHYDSLVRRLRERSYFTFKDYSVPEDNPIIGAKTDAQLEAAIEAKMRLSSVVIIMAGVYATHSKWITKEIAIAKRLGKPIIAITPFGADRISATVREAADEVVGWQTESIVAAIRRWA